MNSWTKFNGEWAIRTQSGNTGDTVTVVSNSGKSSKICLGNQIAPGIFEIFKGAGVVVKAKKPITQTDENGFETTNCTRCCGTGHYSYCQVYGTRCFSCSGKKMMYTERGFAAHKMFIESMKIVATEIQPGMFIRDEILKKWHTVLSVKIEGKNCTLDCKKYSHGCFVDSKIRKGWTDAEKQEKLKAALEYQKTL